MENPHFKIENPVLAALHHDAATVANKEVPTGPFSGDWWQYYLAEVIRQAQAEVIDKRVAAAERECKELAEQCAKLRIELQTALVAEGDTELDTTAHPDVVQTPPAPDKVSDHKALSFTLDSTHGLQSFNPFKKD